MQLAWLAKHLVAIVATKMSSSCDRMLVFSVCLVGSPVRSVRSGDPMPRCHLTVSGNTIIALARNLALLLGSSVWGQNSEVSS